GLERVDVQPVGADVERRLLSGGRWVRIGQEGGEPLAQRLSFHGPSLPWPAPGTPRRPASGCRRGGSACRSWVLLQAGCSARSRSAAPGRAGNRRRRNRSAGPPARALPSTDTPAQGAARAPPPPP